MTGSTRTCRGHRPRELRRRVLLPARMRAAAGWSDALILNLSSRGMMINATAFALQSNKIEIWHQEHLIVATVVWRKGTRAGVLAENPIPVDGIMALSQCPSLQLTARHRPQIERRKRPRSHDDSRIRARAFEFISVTAIVVLLAIVAFAMVEQTFAKPLASVQAALG